MRFIDVKQIGALIVILSVSSSLLAQNRNDKVMAEITVTEEASAFLNMKEIDTINIAVEKIPCGCVRPREVPEIKYGAPKELKDYSVVSKEDLSIYLAKDIIIPKGKIEIKLGTIGTQRKLYPAGIEYFNGVGSYCEFPQN